MNAHGMIPAELLRSHGKSAFALTVVGSFSSAVYFADTENYLWMLHDRQYGSIPFGIAVSQANILLQQVSIEAGMKAWLRNCVLFIPGANLQISLTAAPPVRRAKSAAPGLRQLESGIISAHQQLLFSGKGAVSELIGSTPYENLFARSAAPAWAALQKALLHRDPAAVTASLSGLLGLGIGLTPSLDDFLTGLAYTFRFARDVWSFSLPEAEILSDTLKKAAPERTSAISAAYIVAAADGEYISILEDVLQHDSFCSNQSLQRLLKVGGSSGGDMLTGLICALQYIKTYCI